eukprot:CAMPEP_0184693796 /NCGR_PEP_ID=MMETSP0313-20130426/1955_1 /TAXON_ID=2792 /ORGANISM="Porphyridium aerugineum, Strain SAG 1380-2" /LENGTH=574 /DNA_ID=CAMNT_0027151967 /DNA_START=255 /DNA_END=1979 /DNA_ORIENTATION=-
MNCIQLEADYFNLYWKFETHLEDERHENHPMTHLVVEMEARVGADEYMAVGISGSNQSSSMVGSDVWIGQVMQDGLGTIRDYYISARMSCTGTQGVCPDDVLDPPGVNGLDFVSSSRNGDVAKLRFERHTAVHDPDGYDKEILNDTQTFLVWATGSLSTSTGYPQKHTIHYAKNDVSVIWNQSPVQNDCVALVSKEPDVNTNSTDNNTETATGSCFVMVNGVNESFAGCRVLSGGVTLYYTKLSNNKLDVAFQAPCENKVGWVGFGFSETLGSMVPGHAVIAYPQSDDSVHVGNYELRATTASEIIETNSPALENLAAYFDSNSGMMTARFTYPQDSGFNAAKFNAIWGRGPGVLVSRQSGLRQHISNYYGELNLNSTSNDLDGPTAGSNKIVANDTIIAHAVLMSLSWLLFVPIAIMIARYLKSKDPLWFHLHVAIQTLVICCIITAWVLGLYQGNHDQTAHLVIGCIACSLGLLQFLSGVFRPHKDAGKVRTVWYYFHAWNGRIAWVLAVANVFIGMTIVEGTGDGWFAAVGVTVGVMVLGHVGLEIYFWKSGKELRPEEKVKDAEVENSNA